MDTATALPPQTFTAARSIPGQASSHLAWLPDKATLCQTFTGVHLSSLRTPAFVIDQAIVKRNCAKMHESAMKWKAEFRAHIKTHKTAEGTRMQLSSGANKTYAIIVSTMAEAWAVVDAGLVADGTIRDILYGLPLPLGKISDLYNLALQLKSHGATLRILVDHPEQVNALRTHASAIGATPHVWSVFVKVDPGSKRAGVVPGSGAFTQLISRLQQSPTVVSLFGFYCHAGNSYASKSLEEASTFLSDEVTTVNEAARLTQAFFAHNPPQNQPSPDNVTDPAPPTLTKSFILSVGSTPTAHAFPSAEFIQNFSSALHGSLELHSGNYLFHDLQQIATSLVTPEEIAFRVLSSVVSRYAGRGVGESDEVMVDVGGIGMSKDRGPIDGWGDVTAILCRDTPNIPQEQGDIQEARDSRLWLWDSQDPGWRLGRISQEHGILVQKSVDVVPTKLDVGSTVAIVGQHACLISASYPWYYVVDSSKADKGLKVVDIWVPCKGW